MQIWLGVENFAKIEHAKVCMNRYTLLVGQNNSGKTFLMQLMQGVTAKLASLIRVDVMDIFFHEHAGEYDSYMLSSKNIELFVSYLNEKLSKEKNHIVREIFGKDISIDQLYMDISMTEDVFYMLYIFDGSKNYVKNIGTMIDAKLMHDFGDLFSESYPSRIYVINKIERNREINTLFVGSAGSDHFDLKMIAYDFVDKVLNMNSLFLPSSRTGLLLLYRDFFVNKTDYAISYGMGEGRILNNRDMYGGLTKPTYEFLRFLQMYSESKNEKEVFKEELQFFEDHVIDGHINVDNQKIFFYHSQNDTYETPMYLASSMINETAPIAMAVMSARQYRRLVIDEIEASLHPEKQLELVRFLNRIYRKGMSLIVSTHSDTFVSKMNNLYLLSQYKQRLNQSDSETLQETCSEDGSEMTKILKKMGLELDDLIDAEDLYVYEFVIQPGGKSVVKEIYGEEKTGFQFDLFTDSAMKIYQENLKIGELPL